MTLLYVPDCAVRHNMNQMSRKTRAMSSRPTMTHAPCSRPRYPRRDLVGNRTSIARLRVLSLRGGRPSSPSCTAAHVDFDERLTSAVQSSSGSGMPGPLRWTASARFAREPHPESSCRVLVRRCRTSPPWARLRADDRKLTRACRKHTGAGYPTRFKANSIESIRLRHSGSARIATSLGYRR